MSKIKLELNWHKFFFNNPTNINFKILAIKMIFTFKTFLEQSKKLFQFNKVSHHDEVYWKIYEIVTRFILKKFRKYLLILETSVFWG